MPLIYTADPHGVRSPVALRCDRCQRDYRDVFDLQESLHIHLRAGYGSRWGDGNRVEVAVCDACAVALLSPYAIVTYIDDLPGHHAGGAPFPPDVMAAITELEAKEARVQRSPIRRALHTATFHLHRFLIPAVLLLRPVVQAARRFLAMVAAEDRRITRAYGKTRGSDAPEP